MILVARTQRLFLPDMVKRREGGILNLASTAFAPGPLMAVYYASKAFVLSFSQALSNELKDSGVTVTALCPGATKTGFSVRAGTDKSNVAKTEIDVETFALAGDCGLMSGKEVVIPGFRNGMLKVGSNWSQRAPQRVPRDG